MGARNDRSHMTYRTYGMGFRLIPKQKQCCGPYGTNSEKHDVILHKIGVGHQGQTEEHRLPNVHPFPIHEGNESDGSKEQSAEEISTVENRHIDFLSYFWASPSQRGLSNLGLTLLASR